MAYPKAVLGLPFSDQGNSYFFSDDYDMQCRTANQGGTGGGKVTMNCPQNYFAVGTCAVLLICGTVQIAPAALLLVVKRECWI